MIEGVRALTMVSQCLQKLVGNTKSRAISYFSAHCDRLRSSSFDQVLRVWYFLSFVVYVLIESQEFNKFGTKVEFYHVMWSENSLCSRAEEAFDLAIGAAYCSRTKIYVEGIKHIPLKDFSILTDSPKDKNQFDRIVCNWLLPFPTSAALTVNNISIKCSLHCSVIPTKPMKEYKVSIGIISSIRSVANFFRRSVDVTKSLF